MTARLTIKKLPLLLRLQYPLHRRHQRLISTTIRAATIPIPPALTKRHAILECLTKLAKWGFAKESLVLLAGRGISADGGAEGGVRVGVLGKGDGLGRVVATLLDDPFVGEEGREAGGVEWVKMLRRWCADGGESQGLLIRYGPTSGISTPKNSPVSLLTVPSPLLKPSNIEILLAPIPQGDPTDLTLHASSISGARFIQFPVHKSIVYAGEGETGLQTLLDHDCTTTATTKDGNSNARVLRLLSLPASTLESHKCGSVKIVNLPVAEHALRQLKASAPSSITFERKWLESGFGAVQEWVLDGCKKPDNDGGGVRPVVKALISSIAAQSERVILGEEERLRRAMEKKYVKETYSVGEGLSVKVIVDNFESLSIGLRNWSQNAHSELQTTLTAGFTSHVWGRLAWWKLIWTADDVTGNSREVVSTCLLPQSKKALLFLAGRLAGAGFNGSPQTASQRPSSPEEEIAQFRSADIPSPPTSKYVSESVSEGPYPMHLFTKTDHILSNLIPDLQTSANRLLMGSVSFSVTSVAASSLLYLSGSPVYSSSSVAALGLVLSMRWLQTRWGRERQRFQQAVREQGRIAIVESERWMWQRLKDGVAVDQGEEEIASKDAELERLLEARAIVGRVTKLLGGL